MTSIKDRYALALTMLEEAHEIERSIRSSRRVIANRERAVKALYEARNRMIGEEPALLLQKTS